MAVPLSSTAPATPISCALCGLTPASELDALSWTSSVERQRTLYYCPSCSRANLRSIEAKLDGEYW